MIKMAWDCVVMQAEAKQNGSSVFRRHLLNRLQQEFQSREETRTRSTQEWVCYVSFICNTFDYLKVKPFIVSLESDKTISVH